MGNIDRIRYYDGEFLRDFDFSDEQSYHLEMRRRINRYLHLYGIVQGLQLSEDTEAGITQVSILPGMAIDAYGREIYVFQPYPLGDVDINNNRIATACNYDVWLRYQKAASTPPSSGYGNCNQTNQYTRWAESYSVVLLKHPSHPFTVPGFATDDEDDPTQDQVGVLLGTVNVAPGTSSEFATTTLTEPQFLGVIAQRIRAPFPYDAISAFNFQNKQAPRNPAVSLEIEPNIYAGQNLILGPDFDLNTTTDGQPIKVNPAFTSSPAGNAKLTGDLIVQGNIYSSIPDNSGNPQWLGLSAYVPQLMQQGMPDFVASQPQAVNVLSPAGSANQITGMTVINILSQLSAMSRVVASAAIIGIQFNPNISFAKPVGVFVTNVGGAQGAGKSCNVTVSYTITGDFTAAQAPSIESFYLIASAICFPA